MTWVATARRIVANHSLEYVTDDGTPVKADAEGAMLFDLQSAHVMTSIYDALGDEMKAKFAAMPVLKAQAIAFKLITRK